MDRHYRLTIDIWALGDEERRNLRPGQWVSAGRPDRERNNCGRFYGVKPSGSIVVAWNGNARTSGSVREYQRAQYNYAKGG